MFLLLRFLQSFTQQIRQLLLIYYWFLLLEKLLQAQVVEDEDLS